MADTDKRRITWIDAAKVFSTFLIVMQHSISQDWIKACEVGGIRWNILNFIFMLTRTGVPIFFMCSGIVMLRKKRSIGAIFRYSILGIIRMYICWMLMFGVIESLQLRAPDLRIVINVFLKSVLFGRYHTWFVITLVGLYAITPLLQKITEDKESMRYFLLLSILFTIILPIIDNYEALSRVREVIENVNMKFVVGYTLYFIMGYYISTIEFGRGTKIVTGAVFLGIVFITYIMSNQAALKMHTDCQKLYLEFSPLGFLMTVSGFCFIKACFQTITNNRVEKVIVELAFVGGGIYLFHPILIPLFRVGTGIRCIGNGFIIYGLSLALMLILKRCPVIKTLFLNIK